MKEGRVLLIGRPNVGKSTFLNSLLGQKVSITSPKPQTTRFAIKALFEDERGKIIFTDTPGVFGKTKDNLAKNINKHTLQTIQDDVDVVVYMVDHTRKRDFEESRILGIVRQFKVPKILVVNKIDDIEKTFLPQYHFLKDEFPNYFEISALFQKHMKPLVDKIFELLPDEKVSKIEHTGPYPLLNIDSKTFVAELIREKVFLMMGEEIPYTTTAIVDEITERHDKLTYVKARILTTNERYKRMLIGSEGRKIKEIGSFARKEIALATGKKIYLALTVEVDPHWQETYYS